MAVSADFRAFADGVTLEPATEPAAEDLAALTRGLVASNDARGPWEAWQRVTFFLRGADDTLLGGLDGHTHWAWLFVGKLWVHAAHQRRGYGRALMAAAEREAAARGCGNAHLDTFDFQALQFYRQLGYSVFAELADFPPGHTHYFLRKEL